MKKIAAYLLSFLIVVMLVLSVFKIINSSSADKVSLPKKIVKQMEVLELRTQEENEGIVLEAEIALPDYSEIFFSCYEEAEAEAKSQKQFEKKLYKLAAKEAKKNDKMITRSVTIELSEVDAEKTDWSEKELKETACQAALESEIEEFCLGLLMKEIPREVYEEVQP